MLIVVCMYINSNLTILIEAHIHHSLLTLVCVLLSLNCRLVLTYDFSFIHLRFESLSGCQVICVIPECAARWENQHSCFFQGIISSRASTMDQQSQPNHHRMPPAALGGAGKIIFLLLPEKPGKVITEVIWVQHWLHALVQWLSDDNAVGGYLISNSAYLPVLFTCLSSLPLNLVYEIFHWQFSQRGISMNSLFRLL